MSWQTEKLNRRIALVLSETLRDPAYAQISDVTFAEIVLSNVIDELMAVLTTSESESDLIRTREWLKELWPNGSVRQDDNYVAKITQLRVLRRK